MKTRIKTTIPILASRDDAEAAMNDLALVVANKRRAQSTRDAEVLAINERYAAKLAALDDAETSLSNQLRAWADANPDAFPKGRKSITMTAGSLGFRTGTPKLALLNRAWSWDKVLQRLKASPPFRWIRTREEVDKEAILASYSAAGDKRDWDESLSRNGIKVVQDESFFIEPDLTVFEPRLTAKA